jgi:hypothetical protein
MGVGFGADALPPWIIAVLTTLFISAGAYWLNRKGGCLAVDSDKLNQRRIS